jgi:membrane-bound inhibitor of C-type lysozyme
MSDKTTDSTDFKRGVALAVVAAASLLAGCGGDRLTKLMNWSSEPIDQSSKRLEGTTQYECDGNKRLAVRFGAAGQPVMMVFPEREFRLDPVAGSAGRYSNSRSTLVVQGDAATYDETGVPPLTNCKRPPAPAKK